MGCGKGWEMEFLEKRTNNVETHVATWLVVLVFCIQCMTYCH
tara:strand:- start:3109 stop:3234 length:126 start_codon:yes stop_codon:yes gene_type:complete